jgi:hypothetical protein
VLSCFLKFLVAAQLTTIASITGNTVLRPNASCQ